MHKTLSGLTLLALGLAFLAANYGFFDFSFLLSVVAFWPLLLIAVGLDMSFKQGPVKRPGSLLLGLFLLGYLGLALAAGTYLHNDESWRVGPYEIKRSGVLIHGADAGGHHELASQPLPSGARQVIYQIGFGAGELRLSAAESGDLLSGTHAGGDKDGPKVKQRGSRELEVGIERQSWFRFPWLFGGIKQQWSLGLTPDLPISVDLDTGASDTQADFSELKVERFSLDTGASSTTITLGDQQEAVSGTVNLGAASLTLRIPESMALELNYDGGLADLSLPPDVERDNGPYRSDPERPSTAKLTLEVDAGLGSVTIERYGETASTDDNADADPDDKPAPAGDAVDFTHLTSGSQAPISNVGDAPAILSVQNYLETNPNSTRLSSVLEVYRQEVNYDNPLELLVLQGQQSSGGYRISVDDVRRTEDNVLQVIATLTTPSRTDIVTQVITTPFDLIAVDSEAWEDSAPPKAVELIDTEGNTLNKIDWPTGETAAE